jgi:RimJ/RimL family protein N-acetyltransferase
MYRLEIGEYSEVKNIYYETISKYPVINAVLSKEQDGYVYADIKRENLFVCAKYGWSLLLAKDTSKMGMLFEFLKKNNDIPDYIHLYSPDNVLIDYIKQTWQKYKIRKRCQFRYYDGNHNLKLLNVPNGFYLKEVQKIEFSQLNIFNLDLENRYWNSKEDFIKKAIGVCLLNANNEPVAICYSICNVDNISEIDIYVLPKYQGSGFGKLVTQYYLHLCLQKGITAHWDAFTSNIASIEVAKKMKFRKIDEYTLLSTFLRNW